MRAGVYVLALQGGRYYVGSSMDIDARIGRHRSGLGAAYTRAHAVLGEEPPRTELRDDVESWERAETLQRMRDHGVESVRGWMWTTVRLNGAHRRSIREQMRERFGACRRCGAPGHYVADCSRRRPEQRGVLPAAALEQQPAHADAERGGVRAADVRGE
jgi:hypothetical protein